MRIDLTREIVIRSLLADDDYSISNFGGFTC